MPKPESIENRWDILYRDYPEVYAAFTSTPYTPTIYEQLPAIVPLAGKRVADVGAGTGESSRALARFAPEVIAIEREWAMLRLARDTSLGSGSAPLKFLVGDALALPLAEGSVDIVAGVTLALYPPEQYRSFIQEGFRVAKENVVYVGIPPGWYGGDLYAEIDNEFKTDASVDRIFINEFGFEYQDILSCQEFGTIEHIVSTYGFIFGKKAIEYLRRENKTQIRWKFRIYWKNQGSSAPF